MTPDSQHQLSGTPDPTSPPQSQTLKLPDGRTLGFAEYGSPTGTPAIFMHGLPGTRIDACEWHDTAVAHDMRTICPDRPGFGLSTYQPNRRLLDMADDVRCLARHLGLESYHVFGQSGGGPYALACAYKLPAEEVRGVVVIAGAAPPEVGTKGMRFVQRLFWWVLAYTPWLARLVVMMSGTDKMVKMDDEELGRMYKKGFRSARPRDREILEQPDAMKAYFATVREGFRHGYEGFLCDARVFVSDWGFELEEVQCRNILLFFASEDENVPLVHGRYLAARLPGAELVEFEGDTHFTMSATRYPEIMERVLRYDGRLLT